MRWAPQCLEVSPGSLSWGGAEGFLGGNGGEFSAGCVRALDVRGGRGGGGMLEDDIGAVEVVDVVVVDDDEDVEEEDAAAAAAEEDKACVAADEAGGGGGGAVVVVVESDDELLERLSPPRVGGTPDVGAVELTWRLCPLLRLLLL